MSTVLYVALPYDQGRSGISEYIRATLRELSGRHDVCLLALERDLPELEACLAPGQHRLLPLANHWEQPLASLWFFSMRLPGIARRSGVDAVFIPAGNRRCLISSPVPVVTTVHDLAPLRLQRKYDPLRQLYLQRVLPALLRRAGQLVAISEQTRSDLASLTGIHGVSLALNGCSGRFSPAPRPGDELVLMRHRLKTGSGTGYILYVARIEHPGKNHLGLIQAWQALPPDLRQGRELVLAGSDWKGAEQVHAWMREHGPEGVRFLGYVPDSELPVLYRHAELYVQPSLYEGFGLPLIEAMNSGTPVLSSNCGALPEVGGSAVRLSDPTPEALQQALAELLRHPQQRRELVAAGFKRAREFSWQRHGEILSQKLTEHQADGHLSLLGLKIFNGSREQVLTEISTRLQTRQTTRLYFINADCLNLSCTDPAYRQALQKAELCLPDGSGVALGARLTGQQLVANLNGTDLFPDLCELAQTQGLKVWFLGGQPDVNTALVQQLQQRWPKLKIAGHQHGFTPPDARPALLARLRSDRPDILFVALGAPAQELWIQRHADELEIPLMLGVGGLFDFYSGRIPRAPHWLRRLGAEWCWRLLQEPARLWKRYLVGNPLVIARLLRYGRSAPTALRPCQKNPTRTEASA